MMWLLSISAATPCHGVAFRSGFAASHPDVASGVRQDVHQLWCDTEPVVARSCGTTSS
jgi:hypothetical protein